MLKPKKLSRIEKYENLINLHDNQRFSENTIRAINYFDKNCRNIQKLRDCNRSKWELHFDNCNLNTIPVWDSCTKYS